MADCYAHQEHQRRDDPVVIGAKGQWVVVRQHQEHDRKGQVVVVRRPQFRDFPVFRIRCATFLEVFYHDALVRHDDQEHVRRHDRSGKRAEVQHDCATCEHLIIGPAHHHEQDKQQNHQDGGAFAQRRFAEEIINQPADAEGGCRNQDTLPQGEVSLGWINEV